VRDALWLLSPRDPRSGRVGRRVWLWAIPFVVLFGIWEAFGFDITGPSNRALSVADGTIPVDDSGNPIDAASDCTHRIQRECMRTFPFPGCPPGHLPL
jgi:hypothetical protein